MRTTPDKTSFLPLTPVAFEILISLADAERHGYAIMREVEERTNGAMKLRPGTLYRAIDRLVGAGMLKIAPKRPDPEYDDERRRCYSLTPLGRRVVSAEAERLEAAVASAREKKLIGGRA